MSEITHLYKPKYGEPRAGRKVFIVNEGGGWLREGEVLPQRGGRYQELRHGAQTAR